MKGTSANIFIAQRGKENCKSDMFCVRCNCRDVRSDRPFVSDLVVSVSIRNQIDEEGGKGRPKELTAKSAKKTNDVNQKV